MNRDISMSNILLAQEDTTTLQNPVHRQYVDVDGDTTVITLPSSFILEVTMAYIGHVFCHAEKPLG